MTLYHSNAAAIAVCNAAVDSIDDGAGAGLIRIYDNTGAVPADADASLGTNVLLVTLTFAATAYGAAVDDAPGALATAAAITNGVAVATGTAAFYRIVESAGASRQQGLVTITAGGGDIELDSLSITTSQVVGLTSFTTLQPES